MPSPKYAAFAVALFALLPAAPAQPPANENGAGSLQRHLYPLAPAMPAAPTVTFDVSDFPEGKAWAEKAQKVVTEWYPVVWQLLGTEERVAPKTVKLVFKRTLSAPAYAAGDTITVNGEWINRTPGDFGMMVHELTHLVQAYRGPGDRPGWLTEGIADYIRWWRYEPETMRTRIDPAKARYQDSYRTTAGFLAYLTAKYDRALVSRLDHALRKGTYTPDLFKEMSGGKDLDTLWAEFLRTGGPSYGLPAATAPAPSAALVSAVAPVPPETWTEHWFEHRQTLQRLAFNDDIAVYVDDDTNRAAITAMIPSLTEMWKYTKKTYGGFGPEGRLYYIFHQGKYSGGHPSTYFDASHDNRNVSDSGPGPWTGASAIDIPSHEVSHVVEGANNGIHGSPAFPVWGDSKWAEIYQYDVYKALGREAEAKRLYETFLKGSDSFPRVDTHWFRDWYYPLWRDHGGAQVLTRFFALTAKNLPTEPENGGKNRKYRRDMNFGEYVLFMSGAANRDLRPLAAKAFGPSAERDAQFTRAQSEFPGVTYAR